MAKDATKIGVIKVGIMVFFVLLSILPVSTYGATIYRVGITPLYIASDGRPITYGAATIYVDDAGDANRSELWIDGNLYAYMTKIGSGGSGSWNWRYTIDTRGFTDGVHTIQVRSIGGTGGDYVNASQVWFDNSAPVVKNITVIYPHGYDSAKNGSQIVITAEISDEISGVANVSINASSLGAGTIYMYDDGAHGDKAPGDGIYGTGAFTVYASTAYHYVNITAVDNVGNLQNYTCEVKMDNYKPTLWGMQAILPPGQKAVKLGDKIRIVGYAKDLKMEYIKVTTHIPVDVVLVIDNSRSMAGQPWADLERAATQFIQNLSDEDRISIVSFYPQSQGEQDHLYLSFVTAGEPATCPICGANFSTGRELAIHVITADDGQHLTDSSGDPDAYTPIWDAIGNATLYAWNNHLPGHVPVVIAMTDGDDWGSNWGVGSGIEAGSETFCPGARWSEVGTGFANKTWNITGDLYWGSGLGVYTWNIARYTQNLGGGGLVWSDIDLTDKAHDNTRYGLYGAPLPIFTIGLGVQPQASNSSASGYISPTETTSTTGGAPAYVDPNAYTYNFTSEYNLNITIAKSSGAEYFYAPNSSQLSNIYAQIGQIIQFVGIQWFGITAPHGFKEVYADLSDLGITTPVVMYDDGEHGDGAAGDNLYGTDYVTVNMDTTKLATVWMHGIDLAGNINKTFMFLKVDNTNPVISNATVIYPQNQTWAQDGEKIQIRINSSDVNSGVRKVVVDASSIGGSDNIVLTAGANGTYISPNITVSTGMATGTYTIKITVYDYANNYISQYVDVVVNNSGTPPVSPMVNVLSVTDGSVLRGQATLSIDATDDDGVLDTSNNPIFYVDNAQRIDMQRVSGNNYSGVYSGILDATQYADGEHTLTFEVEDSLGAVTKQTINIIIDNTQPSADVINPASGEYVSGTYAFRIYASDNIEVNNVTVYMDGNALSSAFNSQSGYWEVILDTTTLTDSSHNIYGVVYDTAGNSYTTGTVDFYVDNTPPSLAVISPANNEVISGTYTLQVDANDTNTLNVYYRIDNSKWTTMSGGPPTWTVSLDSTTYSDGSHTIYFKAEDGAGHMTATSVAVIIDNTNPTAYIISPESGEYIEGTYTFKAGAKDDVEVVQVTLYLDGTAYNTSYNTQTGEWEYTIDTTTISDGAHSIYAIAQDEAGYTYQTATVDFYVDNNDPSLAVAHPESNEVISGIYTLQVTASDVNLGSVEYKVDNGGWNSMSNGGGNTYTAQLDTTQYRDGTHAIYFRAIDNAGHITQSSLYVTIDNLNPVAYVSSPVSGEYIQGVYVFKVWASDNVSVVSVSLYIDSAYYAMSYNIQSGYWEYTLDTTTLSDGAHSIYAVAQDEAGHTYTTGTVDFYVDNTPPSLAVISPANNEVISGTYTLQVDANDTNTLNVYYRIDNSEWTPMSGGPPTWNASLNTNIYNDGYHIIYFRAVDAGGHSTESYVNVIFDNSFPVIRITNLVNEQFVEGTMKIQIYASDSTGVSEVRISIVNDDTGQVVVSNVSVDQSGGGYWTYSLDTSSLLNGNYTVTVHGVDLAGYKVSDSVSINVDNKAPYLAIQSPYDMQVLSRNVNITVIVKDTFLKDVEYSVDNLGFVPLDTTLNTELYEDGLHTITVRATDYAGHVSERSISAYFDNSYPSIIGVSVPSDVVSGVYNIAVEAKDAVGIKEVKCIISTSSTNSSTDKTYTLAWNSENNYYELSLDTTKLGDGTYTLDVIVEDVSGKTAQITTQFKIDNTPPDISYTGKSVVSQTGVLSFNIEDTSDIKSVWISIDNGEWAPMDVSEGVARYSWSTYIKDNGVHHVKIKAVDEAGNEAYLQRDIYVNNLNLAPIMYTIALIAAIFAILFFVRGMRKKMSTEPEIKEKGEKDEEKKEESTSSGKKEDTSETTKGEGPPGESLEESEEISEGGEENE